MLHKTEHGREVTAFAKFEWLVRASAACADKLMVDGLGDDVLALNVAFTADADHDAVQKARHQLTESSKRLTTKPFKNSALTECIAKLDSRSLAIKLNQQMETNLKKIIDLELPDMSKLPSTEFHEVAEEHSQCVAAVASFKEAMAKAPPTFNQGFEKLIGDCEEKVSSFFANKSRDLFSHVASECHDTFNKLTICLDGVLADSGSSTTSL